MKMDEQNTDSLIAFLNLLTAEMQLEEIATMENAKDMMPILAKFITSGELAFDCDQKYYNFDNIVQLVRTELGDGFVSSLNPTAAKHGNNDEIAKIITSLVYAVWIAQRDKFLELCEKLKEQNASVIAKLIEHLEQNASSINNNMDSRNDLIRNNGIQIFSSSGNSPQKQSILDEDLNKYKIKAAELKAKLRQVESLNLKLNEQLAITQSEYTELENRFENMKVSHSIKQETLDGLQSQLKENADELEMVRYQNTQLQRDLKAANDGLSRAKQKFENDLKSKSEEIELLYKRLDDYVKQVTEMESLAMRDKFMEQQMANQQGNVNELREELEKTLGRANAAEHELIVKEKNNEELRVRVQKLEESLDKAARVIEEYSTASEEPCSAAEFIQMQHDLEQTKLENERLHVKMDQFKHLATEEQRLITQHWYQSQRELFRLRHGLGETPTPSTSIFVLNTSRGID